MGAASAPMATVGSAVVAPMRLAQGRSTSSVSSATIMPGKGPHQGMSSRASPQKPMVLPKDIFMTASATPFSTAQAAFTLPAWHREWKASQAAVCCPASAEWPNR